MVKMVKNEIYKGFNINFFIDRGAFNMYDVTITKFRFKGTRRQEYFLEIIDTYKSRKKDALRIAKNYIDNLDKIKWASSGLSRAKYLPK